MFGTLVKRNVINVVGQLLEGIIVSFLGGVEFAEVAVKLRLEFVTAGGVLQNTPVRIEEELFSDLELFQTYCV